MSTIRAQNRSKQYTVILAVGLVIIMAGLAASSVPLYRLFCQATGYGGTPSINAQTIDETNAPITSRVFRLSFDSNISPSLPWRFYPEVKFMEIKAGVNSIGHYYAENLSGEETSGMAMFNVTPMKAAKYFNKIACFCFEEQTLAPRQNAKMPVTFYLDPEILEDGNMTDIKNITLSYTFFPADKAPLVPDAVTDNPF